VSALRLRARSAAVLVACGLAVLACAEPSSGPVPITWGRDACDHCRMVISTQGFAAQVRAGGKVFRFDDAGCMVLWLEQRAADAPPPEELWVMDRERLEWIDARAAAWRGGESTPMGYGFAAVAGPREGALGFEEVRAALRAQREERERARRPR
jgi:hypothetical protein